MAETMAQTQYPRGEWVPARGGGGDGVRLARALGWFSVGLGVAELAAPRQVSRLVGSSRRRPRLLQALGAREIVSGVGVLMGRRRAGWMWSRFAGDLVDLALLGAALSDRKSERGRAAAATAAVAGVTALDFLAARKLQRSGPEAEPDQPFAFRRTLAVNCAPSEAYAFWRNFQNLPRFMEHLEAVHEQGGARSRWVVKAPAGGTVECDAEIVEDRPNERIAWRTLEDADVRNSGSVSFEPAPGGRGTLISVEMRYEPPAGAVGRTVAKLFGEDPEEQVEADLKRFKHVLEAGEVPTTEGQPQGRRTLKGRLLSKWGEQ
jgi:uncharacterized membrane protein